jgi:hypothetical protein
VERERASGHAMTEAPNDHQFTTPRTSPRPGQRSFRFAHTLTTISALCPRTDGMNMDSNKTFICSLYCTTARTSSSLHTSTSFIS